MGGLTLYDYWRSSAAYRVRIGLNLKGLSYDAVPVNLMPGVEEQLSDAYRAKNPQGRVPMLESERGSLTQSLAILEWVDETYANPPFLPLGPWQRAKVRAFALAIACDIHPLNNTSVLARLKSQFAAGDAAIGEWYRHWISVGFAALEAQLAEQPGTPFAFGEAPTLADICLVPQVANARRFKTDLAPFPRLVAIDERARAHPAFFAAAPEQQKDAPKP